MLAAQQVVQFVAARLAPTANAAYTDRAWPTAIAALPVWKVTAADEAIDTVGFDGLQEHTLELEAAGLVAATSALDDAMAALAAAGLAALFASPLAGNVSLFHTGIRRALAAEAGADAGLITLRLRAQFHTYAQAPEALV